jgi:RNA polymerase sigma factor
VRILLGLKFIKKKQQDTIDTKIKAIQKGNQDQLNQLILEYKPFVAKTVSSVCKRYIDEKDDEFSIGLIAFHDAIQSYSPEKGKSLLKYSETVIRNRVIDYLRKQTKHDSIVHLTTVKNDEHDLRKEQIEANLSLQKYKEITEAEERKEEIAAYSNRLAQFKLTFSDLAKSSPKHLDARENGIKTARIIAEHDELKNYLLEKKKLPMKQLDKHVDVSRKTLERNRKYIIAVTLILVGNYRYLQDYIKGVK